MKRARLITCLVLAIAIVGFSTAVSAAPEAGRGKGKSDSTSSITLDQSGTIYHGDAVTFTVATTATDRPFSTVTCEQNGELLYRSTRGHFDDYYEYVGEPIHYLSSFGWTGGDADCQADLTYRARNGRYRVVASTTFAVKG